MEIPKLHGCGTLIAGKTLKEACATHTVPERFTCHHYPPTIGLARKGIQLLSFFLYYFSLLHLDRPTRELKLEGLSTLVCRAFCFCLWGLEVFDTYRLLQNLKVMFPFSLTQW